MYLSSVDRTCVKLYLFLTVLLNITFLKIVFTVVKWENENSVSVVKEKKVVGAVELKEGTTVDILTGTNKGRVAIYKTTILNGNARKRHETSNGNTGYPSCFQNSLTCFCHVSVYGFLQFRPVLYQITWC